MQNSVNIRRSGNAETHPCFIRTFSAAENKHFILEIL